MKRLLISSLFLVFFLSNVSYAQGISEINTTATNTVDDIRNGIRLNAKEYSRVLHAYVEYESKLAMTTTTKEKELLFINRQKTIKSRMNANKFRRYLDYTGQTDVTGAPDPNASAPKVDLKGDNANPNPTLINAPTVTLKQN